MYSALSSFWTTGRWIKPHLHALNTSARHAKFGTVLTILRHGTPNFRRVNLSLPHVIWQQCSKFYECRDYLLEVSLGTGKRGTVPKIWRAVRIPLARVNGVIVLHLQFERSEPKRAFLMFSCDRSFAAFALCMFSIFVSSSLNKANNTNLPCFSSSCSAPLSGILLLTLPLSRCPQLVTNKSARKHRV